MTARICDWCRGPIPATARRDSICCSTRCRQARHRFSTAVGVAPRVGGQPRRLAYADPPYPGLSARYYGDHPDYAGEVDHAELIRTLSAEHDAWALSTSAAALPAVLALCPPGVRVAAWFRGERPHTSATVPLNAWEPVIYAGQIRRPDPRDASGQYSETAPVAARSRDASLLQGRRVPPGRLDASRATTVRHDASSDRRATRPGSAHDVSQFPTSGEGQECATAGGRDASVDVDHDASPVDARRIDSLIYPARPRTTDPRRVVGAKPATFARWVFELLGATPTDTFTDVFPGSGGMARAWATYTGSELAR